MSFASHRQMKASRRLLETEPFRELVQLLDRLPFQDYLEELGRHHYVLSPPGKGYDCTRTWEAVAMGCVPLILRDETFDLSSLERPQSRTYY